MHSNANENVREGDRKHAKFLELCQYERLRRAGEPSVMAAMVVLTQQVEYDVAGHEFSSRYPYHKKKQTFCVNNFKYCLTLVMQGGGEVIQKMKFFENCFVGVRQRKTLS
jgi:hypothetical protein